MTEKTSKIPFGVKPTVVKVTAYFVKRCPTISHVYGYDNTPDHNTRECVDLMTRPPDGKRSPADIKALGDKISSELIKLHNAGVIKIKFMVWRGRAWRPVKNSNGPQGWGKYKYPATHFDHVHVQLTDLAFSESRANDVLAGKEYLGPYYVDPRKVDTILYGVNDATGKAEKERKPGFKISTGVKIINKNGRAWVLTEAGYRYALEYLTTTKPNV